MTNDFLLEQRARRFLLENMHENKKRYSFSNQEFAEEVRFLEFHRYVIKINSSPNPDYAIPPAGIEFALAQQ